ncbi:MAG TPA: hypothetical protein PLE99_17860 [Candidatus Thiothrix moscowensis]|uniref:hypothetical protein n=1 Tax=uncultured Thiothrix sp. TaxID=223185 RepID=UPI00263819F0|nr:hypothetical protein [uncultured Thiothrix sp.]HRJ54632.1 hypothetical protein [Candidatus Thiothrix moscowensis]HRJ95039.1 hypothetical protein [Candidatus Thiothrix moscowensis]
MLKLTPLLERFAERTPLPVLARGVLERCLDAPQLDEWFESVADQQYTRKLLFSQVYGDDTSGFPPPAVDQHRLPECHGAVGGVADIGLQQAQRH